MKYLFLYMVLVLLSCSTKEKEVDEIDFGKYVFEDDNNIIHINEKCFKLKYGKNKDGQDVYAKTPIDTSAVMSVERVCSHCVNESAYDHLRNLCTRNKEIDNDRKWLYNKLIQTGYDMGDYDLFIHQIANEQKRLRLYSTAQQEGWNVGTFDEFSTLLGFNRID